MITFQSSGPRIAYARTWSYSYSDTNTVSSGVSTGTPTSSRTSITAKETRVGSGSGIEGSSSRIDEWGTTLQTTQRSGGGQTTHSASFSRATSHNIGVGLTTRSGTSTGSSTNAPTSFTFAPITFTTSSSTLNLPDLITSTISSRYTTTTGSSVFPTTTAVTWSLADSTVSPTQIDEYLAAGPGVLTSPVATDAWYPQASVAALPCAYAYIAPTPLSGPTPFSDLATATELTTAVEVLTWITNANTVTASTSQGFAAGGSSTVASTYLYARTPSGQLGSTYHYAVDSPQVAVPRLPAGWQNAISSGANHPIGYFFSISVASSVTDLSESILRLAGTTTERDFEGVSLALTLNTADTFSLLGTSVVTLVVPIDAAPIAYPGGGYPDGTAVATVTWPSGIFDVTSVSATLGSTIASGSYRTTVTAESTQTLSPALALGVRVIPALIPTGTYTAPASTVSSFTALSTPQETRTGANAVVWIDTTCQPTWPDPGDDVLDGIFD